VAARCDDPVRGAVELVLAGLDYSVGLYCPHRHSATAPLARAEEVILVMQCRLFGDVGGAGMPPLRGVTAVRLDRSTGQVMSDDEVKQRSEFRDGFIGYGLGEAVDHGLLRPVREAEGRDG